MISHLDHYVSEDSTNPTFIWVGACNHYMGIKPMSHTPPTALQEVYILFYVSLSLMWEIYCMFQTQTSVLRIICQSNGVLFFCLSVIILKPMIWMEFLFIGSCACRILYLSSFPEVQLSWCSELKTMHNKTTLSKREWLSSCTKTSIWWHSTSWRIYFMAKACECWMSMMAYVIHNRVFKVKNDLKCQSVCKPITF